MTSSTATAAASGLSKKPHFPVTESPSKFQQITSKSNSNSLCKTLIVLLLLLIIPLFPSQAPDFITQSIFTEFWEIIHLLFIGIAVSYGLFGRKSASETVPVEKIVHSGNNDDSHAYLSGFAQLSSIFEDGFENLCVPDEQYSYANCLRRDEQFLGQDNNRCVVNGGRKIQSLVSNDGSENVCEDNWKLSQYSKGESLVVVSNGEHFVDGSSDFMPLNLPVRSLRSEAKDNDKDEINPKIEVNPNVDVNVVKIRGVVPTNLEKKFEEASRLSPIPWRSRSMRTENAERKRNRKPPIHCRPHSVGEFEFEKMKSKLTSRGSKFSSSPELRSSKVENVERGKNVISVSHPKTAPINDEASIRVRKGRTFSNGESSSETNGLWNFEYYTKNQEEDVKDVTKEKQAIESVDLDIKSPTLAKVLSRAKSVRTIKPKRSISGEKGSSQTVQNQEFDSIFPMPKPKPTLNDFNDEEKEDLDDGNVSESEEEREENDESAKNSVEEADDVRRSYENDTEFEGSEVDRKAGEFIAKFREQIRLQKISSVGGGNSGW